MPNKSNDYSYLNNHYYLVRCGDIHGADVTSYEVLDRYSPYDNYLNLFDKNASFMNYQCKGTSYDDFWCEGSLKIVDVKGAILLQSNSFECWTNAALYHGVIRYKNNEDKEQIGNIYVFAPYWCRIQLNYDVSGSGDIKLITFEFWKGEFNELPGFLKNDE